MQPAAASAHHEPPRLKLRVNRGSGALRRAAASGSIPLHLSSFTHADAASLDEAIRDALLRARVQVVFLGGYMKRLGPRTLAARVQACEREVVIETLAAIASGELPLATAG